MLRIGKLTDYATVLLGTLAQDVSRVYAAAALAESTGIAVPTTAKLLKELQRAGLVRSVRGLHGGYQLARTPNEISAAEILDALEGPLTLTDCSAGAGFCEIQGACRVSRTWQRLNLAIRRSLQEVTLAQLAGLDAALPRLPLDREFRLATRAGKSMP